MITQERLKELLYYDPDTGLFTWLIKPNRSIVIGSIAGTLGLGYIQIRLDGKLYKAHRLVWLYCFGEWPKFNIDHINRIRDDNRLDNLRDVSQRVNCSNSALNTGLLGCAYKPKDSASKPWRASISYNHKNISLGSFTSEQEAHLAYLDALNDLNLGITPSNKTNSLYGTGLSYDIESNRWKARISINNKRVQLGFFNTKEEALVRITEYKESLKC